MNKEAWKHWDQGRACGLWRGFLAGYETGYCHGREGRQYTPPEKTSPIVQSFLVEMGVEEEENE